MKRFFQGKMLIMLIVLVLLGSVVAGSFVLHSMNRASTAGNCASTSVQYSTSNAVQSCAYMTFHSHVRAIANTTTNLHGEVVGPKLLSIPRQVAPTPPPTPKPQPLKLSPTPLPTTIPVPTSPGQAAVIAMINQVFGSFAAGALRVARCESGFNPAAYNPISIGGSHAAGVFQILYPSTWDGTSEASSSPYSAMANILAAHQIFVRDGYNWHEWSCAA